MSTLEIISFILVVVAIFISPFFLLKIFAGLKTKIESQVSMAEWGIEDQKSYRLQREGIRGYAQIFIFLGILLVVLALLNDMGNAVRLFYIMGALMFILGAFGVWYRYRWAVWFTLFPLLAFGIYSIWLDWKNLIIAWVLFLFTKIAVQVDKSIQQIQNLESGGQ